jgi:hypothetical protein
MKAKDGKENHGEKRDCCKIKTKHKAKTK